MAKQLVGEDRRLLHGRTAVAAADAGEHGGDVAVACVERTAELAVAPADPGQAALERRNADAGLGLRREIEPDGLRLGRQFVETVAAQKGSELPPVGIIGARGVFGSSGARVAFRGFGQPGEARIGREQGRGAVAVVGGRQLAVRGLRGLRFGFVPEIPTPGRGLVGLVWVNFFGHLGNFESRPISPPYRT